jgi:hypothetical protein
MPRASYWGHRTCPIHMSMCLNAIAWVCVPFSPPVEPISSRKPSRWAVIVMEFSITEPGGWGGGRSGWRFVDDVGVSQQWPHLLGLIRHEFRRRGRSAPTGSIRHRWPGESGVGLHRGRPDTDRHHASASSANTAGIAGAFSSARTVHSTQILAFMLMSSYPPIADVGWVGRIMLSSHQAKTAQAGMAIPRDNHVVVDGDPKQVANFSNLLGHVDIGAGWRGVAGRVIVHQHAARGM